MKKKEKKKKKESNVKSEKSLKVYKHKLPIETWLSHSMAVVKLQKLLSNAKRCVFQLAIL
jgi:hypothetical protein